MSAEDEAGETQTTLTTASGVSLKSFPFPLPGFQLCIS